MNSKNELPVMSRIGVIFLTWRRSLQKRLLPYGITLKQLYVLRRLEIKEVLSPTQIAEMLYCDRPTATSILNTMKRYGWIESGMDPLNHKKQQVRLTAKGRDKLKSLSEISLEPAFDPMACFTQTEQLEFERLIKKLNAHIKNIPAESTKG